MADKKPALIPSAREMDAKAKRKLMLVLAGGVVVLFIVARWLAAPDPSAFTPPPPPVIDTTPGGEVTADQRLQQRVTTQAEKVELLQDELEAMRTQIEQMRKESEAREAQLTAKLLEAQARSVPPAPAPESAHEVQSALPSSPPPLDGERYKVPPAPAGTVPPPPPPGKGYVSPPPVATAARGGAPSTVTIPADGPIVVVSDRKRAAKSGPQYSNWVRNQYAGFLPPGSFADIALLTGVDAGTSDYVRTNPQPLFFRFQSDAVLPGAAEYGLKGCHGLGSGYGDMSAERVYVQLTEVTCVSTELRSVVTAKVMGYIADSDGVLGMRGKIINRQGARLAKAILAGFAQGAAELAASASQTVTFGVGSGVSQTVIDPNKVAEAGAYKGAANAANLLAEQYIKEAQSIFPVISVPPGRRGTVVFTEGQSLKWEPMDGLYKAEPQPPTNAPGSAPAQTFQTAASAHTPPAPPQVQQ